MRAIRPAMADAATGAGVLAAWALAFVVHVSTRRAFEYSLIVVPAALFPLATWWRARRSASPRRTTFLLVNAWLVAGIPLAGWAVGGGLAPLLPVLGVTLAASALAVAPPATAPGPLGRALGVAVTLAPAAATFALVPRIAERLLVRPATPAPAPDVKLALLDGSALSTASLRGRVVVLNFWGVWCGPCEREFPELEAVARAHRGRSSAAFLAVDSALGDETVADVEAFVARHGITIPVAYDPARAAYGAFDVQGLPTTVVVDPRGNVRFRRVGYLASAEYARWLDGAIADLERGD